MDYKKIVFIEDDARIKALDYISDANIDEEISIVSYQYELEKFTKQFQIFPDDVKRGACLVLDPYNTSRYIPLSQIQERENETAISNIYKLVTALGAKKFKHKEQIRRFKSYEIDCSVNASIKITKLKTEVKIKNDTDSNGEWILGYENLGSKPNIEEAKKILNSYNFAPKIAGLVNSFEYGNPNTEFSEIINTSLVSNSYKEIASSLAVAGGAVFSINANFCSQFTERKEYHKELSITW